ncbi:hypothetical protein BOX15_Mlig020547g1 [Macrostomum lignano]|uniref:WSC domain-containing protein n=1 Tax=Macrostomum lignano TaxID=282301 RepID=A0A267H817_9PLAT|nr:hypothetical protein BOX15_Mlig020547g1 [Macrostomum lignano]
MRIALVLLVIALSVFCSPVATSSEHSLKRSVHKVVSKRSEAESKPPKAESKPPKAESKPPKAESKPPKAESKPPKSESKPPKAESKPPKADPERIGCFKEVSKSRDLPFRRGSKGNAPEHCKRHCKEHGYLYAGVQKGSWCFCGNSFTKHVQVDDSECNTKCSGDSSRSCGGTQRTEIYSTVRRKLVLKGLGCFIDSRNRDLPIEHRSNVNTPGFCLNLCASKGFMYAGVQASEWCFCGNSLGKHGIAKDSDCNIGCSGDRRQSCGGHWRNFIYTTGVPVPK